MEAKVQVEDGGQERKKMKLTNIKYMWHLLINWLIFWSSLCSISSSFSPLACEPKVYQNAGLRKMFKSKNKEMFDPLSSGGLDDDDALSTCPTFLQARSSRQTAWDQMQKNEVGLTILSPYYMTLMLIQWFSLSKLKQKKAVKFNMPRRDRRYLYYFLLFASNFSYNHNNLESKSQSGEGPAAASCFFQ